MPDSKAPHSAAGGKCSFHGLEPKNGDGKILVEIGEKEGCLHIVVEDNGVGFDTTALEKEQPDAGAALGEIEHTHMGLANTKRLIQILYGAFL